MDFHSMKRKELQALCKKHNIPANLKNSEMANRLTSILKLQVEDKLLGENGCGIEGGAENKRVRKVRFSPETQTFEYEKSEVKYITRSRGRRLVEKAAAAKKKEGKVGTKNNEALGSISPSDVENIDRVMTRKSSRRREVVSEGEGKSTNEDMDKGLKRKLLERNLRQGKDKKARDNAAEGGERDAVFMEVSVGKVFRRSTRNVTKVDDYKLMDSGTVVAGTSLEPENGVATEAMEGKEKSPVVLNSRRSRRNVSSNNQPLITLNDLVADVNHKRKRQRRGLVEQETVLVDSISIELPLAPLPNNVNSSERDVAEDVVDSISTELPLAPLPHNVNSSERDVQNFAQEAERESKKQTLEIEESLRKDLPDVDVQPSLAEVTEGSIARVSEKRSFTDNLKKIKRRSGRNSGRKSPPKVQDSSKDVFTASESAELGTIQPGVGVSHCKTTEINQLDSTDSRGIQIWVELSIGMETMSRPASLDHLVEDERVSSVNNQEYINHQGFESAHGDVLERDENDSLTRICERERYTSSMQDQTSEVNLGNVKDAVSNFNDDCNSNFNSGRALACQDLSQTIQPNNVEIDDVSGHRNIDQEEQICTKSDKPLKENYDTTVTRMLRDENDNGGDNPEQSAGLEMKHSGVPSTDKSVTETSCSPIEYGTLISSSETIETVLELNSTSDDQVVGTIVEGGRSILQVTNVHKEERSIDVMDCKTLESRKQSPNIQWRDAGLNDATKAERHFADANISAEDMVDKYLKSNPSDSFECKLNKLGDVDTSAGEGFDGSVDSERSNLATEVFSADTTDESNENYENQPEEYGDADFIESGSQEAEKVDNNFGELASSTSTMKVDIDLEQKGQSAILSMSGSKADSVAEEDIAHDQLDLKNFTVLDQSVEDRDFDKPCLSHYLVSECGASDPCKRSTRRMLEIDVLNSSNSSNDNTEGKKEGSAGLVELCGGKKCLPAENAKYDENPAGSEDVAVTTKCGSSICSHVSMEHYCDESCSAMNSGLVHRDQSPFEQGKGGEAGSVAEVNWKYDQGVLKCDEQYRSPNECRTSSIPGTYIGSGTRLKISYEVQSNKVEKFSFIQPCTREQCTSTEGDDYKENPANVDHAMATMKTEDPNSTMNLGTESGQREHYPAVDRNVCEADSGTEVDKNYGKEELMHEELPNDIEDRPFKDGEDSTECQKNVTSSRKTFRDESIGFTDFHAIKKCNSVIDDNSEEVLICCEEHPASQSLDMALDQRKQTPVLQICPDNVTGGHESHAQLELYCDESTKSADDRCMEEHQHLSNKCLVSEVSYSPTSARRMLQDEIVGCSEDSVRCLEHYNVTPEEDATAGPIESFVMDRYTNTNNYEADNPDNSEDAMTETIRTVKFVPIPMVDNNEDHINTRNLEMKLEKSDQSLAMQHIGCGNNTVAENNRNREHKELDCDESAKLIEGRPSEEICNSPDKCQMPSLSNPSRRTLEDRSSNAGKDFNKAAGDTTAKGIHSPLCDNDALDQASTAGDEIFAENGTKDDGNGICEKLSELASSEHLSEANFNVNNFQEEFSCKGQEDYGEEHRENLTCVLSQVQFAASEIRGEDKILNIVDDVSSNLLYKNYEILKECDVADTINEYIESESIMNPSSLRIDDNSDNLKVPDPEDKVAEETDDIITGRKSELSLERDQEKALRSTKNSDSKHTTNQWQNSDIVANENIVLGKQLTSEMREKDMRVILIHGTPRKLQIASDMKENLPGLKIEKVGSLTTVKPTFKRTALRDVFIQK